LPVQELERLLARSRSEPQENLRIDVRAPASRAHPDHVQVISDALAAQRVLRLHYRGAKDQAPKARRVHPVQIQVVDGAPYLIAWDEQAKALRKFKVARVTLAKKLREKCRVPSSALGAKDSRARSVKVWSDHPVDVRIRIAKAAARYVHEWPLVPEQTIEDASGGAVDVCARVYGIDEALRWVLRWGASAEVIEPRELRERVVGELSTALASYRREGRRSQLA
jgi:predicted DNA-binding transcriptional regulator YafY